MKSRDPRGLDKDAISGIADESIFVRSFEGHGLRDWRKARSRLGLGEGAIGNGTTFGKAQDFISAGKL
jgi:hypothetical protein